MHRPTQSSVVIAKLLDSEGFTDHVANKVEAWWKRNRVQTDHQRKRVAKLEAAFSEFASKLTQQERYLLGKFIGMKSKQGLECGMAIGLTVSAVKTSRPVDEIV